MSVNDAIAAFIKLSEEVYSERKSSEKEALFSASALENALKDILKSAGRNPDELMLNSGNQERVCLV